MVMDDRIEPLCWRPVESMPLPRYAAAAARAGDSIFISGGRSGIEVLKSVLGYVISNGTWFSVSDMSSPRYGHVSVGMNGVVYVVGGNSGLIELSSCEVLLSGSATGSLGGG